MSAQVSINPALYDWVDVETRPLDVVASWESLCDTYDALKFIDPISDAVRLEEFKWVIREMNKFLSRIRSRLLHCESPSTMIRVLLDSFTPSGQVKLDGRKNLAYQKLRQRWISQTIATLQQYEEGESNNGWTEPGDE